MSIYGIIILPDTGISVKGEGGKDMMFFDGFPFVIFSWVFPMMGILLFVAVIISLFRRPRYYWGPFGWWGSRERHYWRRQDEALDILNKRYASGEITKEEYERIKSDLRI